MIVYIYSMLLEVFNKLPGSQFHDYICFKLRSLKCASFNSTAFRVFHGGGLATFRRIFNIDHAKHRGSPTMSKMSVHSEFKIGCA